MTNSVGHAIVTSFVVFLALVSATGALDLSFTECDNNNNNKQVLALRSSTCKSDPCRVPIGGRANVEVDFISPFETYNVTINVFASVFGFKMPLPLEDTNACKEGRLNCNPLLTKVKHTLKYDLEIKKDYYPVSGDVGFRLTSDDGATVACAMFSAELYTPSEDEPLDEHQEL